MDTWDNHVASGYAGGNGTSNNPYRIETAGQLAYMAKQSRSKVLTEYYSLENSLDMSEYLWLGIGSERVPFCGNFNGNFNTVSGITMNITDNSLGYYTGFFNYIKPANNDDLIKDLILSNGTIFAKHGVGCLVGKADVYVYQSSGEDYADYYEVSISNCIVENYTAMSTSYIGGFIERIDGTDFSYLEDGEWLDENVYVNIANSMVKNCNFIAMDTAEMGGFYVEGDYGYTTGCAVIDVTFICTATTTGIFPTVPTWDFGDSIYGKTTHLNTSTGVSQTSRVLKGGSNAWHWNQFFYNPNLNGGYPIPRALLKIAPSISQTSTEVYNYLVSLGFSAS